VDKLQAELTRVKLELEAKAAEIIKAEENPKLNDFSKAP
jgi:hypothetical protein